jgi:hypothetical protein
LTQRPKYGIIYKRLWPNLELICKDARHFPAPSVAESEANVLKNHRSRLDFLHRHYFSYLALITLGFFLLNAYAVLAMLHGAAEAKTLNIYSACANIQTVSDTLTDDAFSKFLISSSKDVMLATTNRKPFTLDQLSPTARVLYMDRLEKSVLSRYSHGKVSQVSRIEIGSGSQAWQIFFDANGHVHREQIVDRPLAPSTIFCGHTYPVTQYGDWAAPEIVVRSDFGMKALARLEVSFLIISRGGHLHTVINHTGFDADQLVACAARGTRVLSPLSPVIGSCYDDAAENLRVSFGFTPALLLRSVGTHYSLFALASLILFAAAAVLLYKKMAGQERYFAEVIAALDMVGRGTFCCLPTERHQGYFRLLIDAVNRTLVDLEAHLRREREDEILRHKLESQVMLLQVNPHFLYNAMESLCALAASRGDRPTADAVASMSTLYRALVKEPAVITLEREMVLIDGYLHFQELTRQDRFCYSIELDEALRPVPSLRFWLQPLAENYFRYSFDPERSNNILIIRGTEERDLCRFEMVDNGLPIPEAQVFKMNKLASAENADEDASQGLGIANTSARLRWYYGPLASIRFRANERYGLTVVVQFPRRKGGDPSVPASYCG